MTMLHNVSKGIYKHYKGAYYHVLGITTVHDTEQRLVIYTSTQAETAGVLLSREYDDFVAQVPWPDGVTRDRFMLDVWLT